jgi:hypothetical protein
MVFAAPELVVPQAVEQRDELDIAANLQGWVFADGVMGCEENAKFQTRHSSLRELHRTGSLLRRLPGTLMG